MLIGEKQILGISWGLPQPSQELLLHLDQGKYLGSARAGDAQMESGGGGELGMEK